MASIPLPALDIKTPQQPDILEKFGQLQQLRASQQQLQMQQQEAPLRMQALQQGVQSGQLDIQAKQQEAAARQAMNAAFAGAVTRDENGNPSFDENKLAQGLANGPAAYKTPEVMKGITDFHKERIGLQTSITDLQSKQADMIGSAASAVKAANYDPTLAHSLLDTLPQSPQLDQIRQQIDNPQALHQLIDTAIQNSPKQRELNVAQAKADQQAANQDAMRKQAADNAKQTQLNENRAAGQRQQGLSIEGARLKFEQAKAGMGANGQPSELSAAIARGQIAPERMAYLIARNPEVLQGVMQADPTFDSSKAASYPQVYKDFTSGKTSVALNAGATALGHLSELKNMNTAESHIPGTPDYNAYQNKADTLSSELAKFYGDATIPAIAAIKKTLTATLPGNRDAAIKTQAQSMGDKLDSFQQTWQNAAPSKAYQAPMPGISPKAQAARQALAGGGQQQGGGNVAPEGTIVQTQNGPMIKRGGQWVKP